MQKIARGRSYSFNVGGRFWLSAEELSFRLSYVYLNGEKVR